VTGVLVHDVEQGSPAADGADTCTSSTDASRFTFHGMYFVIPLPLSADAPAIDPYPEDRRSSGTSGRGRDVSGSVPDREGPRPRRYDDLARSLQPDRPARRPGAVGRAHRGSLVL
jgi:hypothetical protein